MFTSICELVFADREKNTNILYSIPHGRMGIYKEIDDRDLSQNTK